jgi:uncharacterized protein (TIGR02246 family)
VTDTVETGTAAPIYAEDVVRSLCVAYASAVNASDSLAYSKLFTEDAIRMPPGTEPERGRAQIRRAEQADYDHARLNIRSTPVDAIEVADGWVYGIAQVDGTATSHSDGSTSSFRAMKTWLLHRQPSGEWLIARQMWNLR